MRLNEGWFRGPLTRTNFGRHFYRPAPSEQVEWTFPVAYKDLYFDRSLPETQALMRLIDELRPALLVPSTTASWEVRTTICRDRRPTCIRSFTGSRPTADLGEPDNALHRAHAAIFRMSSPQDAYEFAVRMNVDPLKPASGGSSTSYAGRWGTFSIVSETPDWTHREAADRTPTSTSYREVLRRRGEGAQGSERGSGRSLHQVRADLVGGRPFALAVDEFGGSLGRMGVADLRHSGESQAQRAATVAERFSCADLVHCFRLRYGGMLARLLDGQLAIGNGTPPIRRHQRRFAAVYAGWCWRGS